MSSKTYAQKKRTMRLPEKKRKKRKMMRSKVVILKSSDGASFVVDDAVALESQTIKQMIEDYRGDDGIPLPNVTSNILSKVIEYCKKHVESHKSDDPTADEELRTWDAEFVLVEQATTLLDLAGAANYLKIESLLDLACQAIADRMKGLTVEKMREMFNLRAFNPENEARIRRENPWVFE